MENNKLYSIIVPIYNAEKDLHICLNSIVNQSYKNWECLLINDGSEDNSGSICESFAQKDPRFRVFNKQNGGASSARNLGLSYACGDMIVFIDSDDWCEDSWLEDFVNAEYADIIIQGFKAINWHGCHEEKTIRHTNHLYCKDEIKEYWNVAVESGNIGFLWCRAFKRSIIKNNSIFFNQKFKIHEDEEFICHYMVFANTYAVIDKCSYHYNTPNFILKYKDVNLRNQLECNELIIGYVHSMLRSYRHPYMKLLLERYVNFVVNDYRKALTKKEYEIDPIYSELYKQNIPHKLKTKIFFFCNVKMRRISVVMNHIIWRII